MKSLVLLAALAFGFVSFSCKSTKMGKSNATTETGLNGSWELNYISGPKITFEGLYPNKKPALTFDTAKKQLSGNTGCNSLNGPFTISEKAISFKQPLAMTKMFCEGGGETTFIETLKQVDNYAISDDGKVLSLSKGNTALMRFERK
jgi:heat shock protein HslJ